MINAVGITDIGLCRQANQDKYAIIRLDEETLLVVVCDGMGGENGGDTASRMAVEVISKAVQQSYRSDMTEASIKRMLESAIDAANISIYDEAQATDSLRGMGTTAVVIFVCGQTAYIMHVGDSRVYKMQNGEIEQVTKDHTVVQMLVERGELTEEQAQEHPNKHLITRAVGVEKELQADYSVCELGEGTLLLACTDGLSNHLQASELFQIAQDLGPQDCVKKYVQRANENGGQDNITAVLLY